MLYPTTLELLSLQESEALCWSGAVPLPVKDSAVGEFEALLTNEALSEAVPLDSGVKSR